MRRAMAPSAARHAARRARLRATRADARLLQQHRRKAGRRESGGRETTQARRGFSHTPYYPLQSRAGDVTPLLAAQLLAAHLHGS